MITFGVRLIQRVGPAGWRRLDAVVAVAMLGLTVPVLLGHPPDGGNPAAVAALGAGATLPLAVRRRWPVAVLLVIVACMVGADLLGIQVTPFGSNASPSVALAMYTVAVQSRRPVSLAVLAVVAVVTFVSAWLATFAYPAQDTNAVHTAAALAGWFVGDSVRARRRYRADLATRRRQETDERTRRAVAEERLQISREVHDVISHNLSVIAVRSGVGRMLFDSQPEQARAALTEVETISRDALTELRRLLADVRDPQSLTPMPRLDDLPELLARVTAHGVAVTVDRRGATAAFHPTLELSAYRIIQEALTNIVKHVGRTRAHVSVEHTEEALLVEVIDDGTPGLTREPTGVGWGIVGMRERAALFGGTLTTGPRPGGGYRVSARLPTDRADGGSDT